ncbi:MAG: hypothetical protein OIN66_10835 [Candidatus Methanoperedens sp.]|nr:hypothetical protein [Candidatus Methanoperedens sp.]
MRELPEIITYFFIGVLIGQIKLFDFMFPSISVSIVYFVLLSIVLIPRLGEKGVYLILGFYISNLYSRFF